MQPYLDAQSKWTKMQEEFLLKTGGVRVDWKFRNIVMDRKHGPPMLLETIQPQADDKLKAQ